MSLKLPQRPKDGHKGTFGTVAVAGGQVSDDAVMLGSAAFAAKAALRSGVGLVNFLGEKELLTHLVKMVPQAVASGFKDLEFSPQKWSSIVVGPGWAESTHNVEILEEILKLKKPTVIDASALNLLSLNQKLLKLVHSNCVLTPHLGEFEKLSKAINTTEPSKFAKKLGCILVLKSNETVVTDGHRKWSLEVNNPVLATGGTGDVLAGLIGGLIAQYKVELSIFECAQAVVEIQAKAAKEWHKLHGSGGLIIEELLELIPAAMDKMR